MTVLFFTYDLPFPANSGGKTRAYNLIKHGKKGARIILCSFRRDVMSHETEEELKRIGIEKIYTFPRRRAFSPKSISSFFSSQSLFRRLYFDESVAAKLLSVIKENEVDLVHFESFYTACYISEAIRMHGVKQVYGTENIEHAIYTEYAMNQLPILLKGIGMREVAKIKKEEESYYKRADKVLAVTQKEAEYIRQINSTPCVVIPNGVDSNLIPFEEIKIASKNLLFIGNFSYFPNVDGIRWFLKEVLPLLPDDILLTVVGKHAEKIKELNNPRISTISYIPKIIDAYRKAAVFISPIRMGGGTNFKVLEAMAAGVPVVAMSEKAAAIGLKNEEEILLADNPEAFAKHINRLLTDQVLARRIAKNANKAVLKKFSWETIGDRMHAVWEDVLYEKN